MTPSAASTILVVDDDFDVREALCDVLREEGFAVDAAADGLEALDYLRHHAAPPRQQLVRQIRKLRMLAQIVDDKATAGNDL